jgi:hypothetical protein
LIQAPYKQLAPSLLALLLQLIGFLASVLLFQFAITPYQGNIPPVYCPLLAGVLSCLLARLARLAIWWCLILLFFPVSIWLMSFWQIPGYFYLAGFLLSAGLFWTTFRTQVPFYPSKRAVWDIVSNYLPTTGQLKIIDIGCGLGDFSMALASSKPEAIVSGIEIAPLPWMISCIRGKLRRSQAHFMFGNYNNLDFSKYDVIVAYLSPAAMPQLWEKACKEMVNGSELISHEFIVPGADIYKTLAGGIDKADTYVYQITQQNFSEARMRK